MAMLVRLALVALTLSVFAQVARFDFLSYDDPGYVTENPVVLEGLTAHGFRWAMTAQHAANWHPLTWMSLMLDASLYGAKAGGFHVTNVLLHLAATLVLFQAFYRMTGALWPSAVVAALFAVHPQHVESVAWIAERKDVLSGLCFALVLWSYQRYAAKPGVARYAVVVVFLALGLSAKPMLVTVPFVLLLLDYWPLRRFQIQIEARGAVPANLSAANSRLEALIVEKVPLLVLTVASCAVTLQVQSKAGALRTVEGIPLSARMTNAAVVYVLYLAKTFWPTNLSVLYLHPATAMDWSMVALCIAVLFAITAIAFASIQRLPWLFVGWMWYLGMLVPVIGVVQVGAQARADRYTYLPLIGVFVMLAWGTDAFVSSVAWRRRLYVVGWSAIILILARAAWRQTTYWSDDFTLYGQVLQLDPDNAVIRANLATAFERRGKYDDAVSHYRKALAVDPKNARTNLNLGIALFKQRKLNEAERSIRRAAELAPGLLQPRMMLGAVLAEQQKVDDAIREFQTALAAHPRDAGAHHYLGVALLRKGDRAGAQAAFERALQLDPNHRLAHGELARLLAAQATDAEKAGKIEPAKLLRERAAIHAAAAAK